MGQFHHKERRFSDMLNIPMHQIKITCSLILIEIHSKELKLFPIYDYVCLKQY